LKYHRERKCPFRVPGRAVAVWGILSRIVHNGRYLIGSLSGKGEAMKSWRLWRVALSILLVALLAACGGDESDGNGGDSETGSASPQPPDQLVIDSADFDPDATYTFDNPGGWTGYQQVNLSDPGEAVSVSVLVSADDTGTFAEYIESWTHLDYVVLDAENGYRYTVTVVGDTPSVFVESPDGIRWSYQIFERVEEVEREAYIDPVLEIGLSARYIPRATDE